MRQRLTALTLAGTKVATGDLWQQGYVDEGEAVEEVGERLAVLDDDDRVVAIIEITRVEAHHFDSVPWEFANAKGEGFRSIEHWRDGHARISPSMVSTWMKIRSSCACGSDSSKRGQAELTSLAEGSLPIR
jgi:uncharacterized protein YhfF